MSRAKGAPLAELPALSTRSRIGGRLAPDEAASIGVVAHCHQADFANAAADAKATLDRLLEF